MPTYTTSVFVPISAHIPIKINENIWLGKYIELRLLLKSAKDLVSDCQLNGELAIKGGMLTVVPQKQNPIQNISSHVWTSFYMVFISNMLEKWLNKSQGLRKYMHIYRLAATRGSNIGRLSYDEQYRLRKHAPPQLLGAKSTWSFGCCMWLPQTKPSSIRSRNSLFLTEIDNGSLQEKHLVYTEEYSKKVFVPDGVITGANVNLGIPANLCINVPNVSVDIRQTIVTNKTLSYSEFSTLLPHLYQRS